MYEKYKDFDFADAKSVSKTPHLAKLQAETGGKYQTLMNEALKQFSQGLNLADVVREVIHETLETCLTTRSTGRSKKLRTG
jgi:hypothetical protein